MENIQRLIKLHSKLLEEIKGSSYGLDHPLPLFEIRYSFPYGWTASMQTMKSPTQKILAFGEGDTADQAASEALKDYYSNNPETNPETNLV